MQKRPADVFLKEFNNLENWLRKQSKDNKSTSSVPAMLDQVPRSIRIVHSNISFLKSLATLRNTIVHAKDYPEQVIADPRAEVIQKLQSINTQILKPQKLLDMAEKKITVFNETDKLSKVLEFMHKKNYSQVVLRKVSKELGLITREDVARWLESNIAEDIVSIGETGLSDVLKFQSDEIWKCVSRKTNFHEGVGHFDHPEERVQALIITENGKLEETPLGIYTIWELSKSELYLSTE